MRAPWRPKTVPDRRPQADHAVSESLAELTKARAQSERMRHIAATLVRRGADNRFTEGWEQTLYGGGSR